MTAPNHYSRDIVLRCQSLIDNLLPKIEGGLPNDTQFGGPLGTTFLLAMATPMIVLPIERLFKPKDANSAQAGDDRELDPALAQEVDKVLGEGRPFGEAPFVTKSWSYVEAYPPFNIASAWPDDLLASLAEPQAIDAAQNAPARRILLDLRNALAHGGIAYLNGKGRNSLAYLEGWDSRGQTEMFGFVGTKKKKGKIVGLNVLRVHQDHFGAFLGTWTEWLNNETSVLKVLNADRQAA